MPQIDYEDGSYLEPENGTKPKKNIESEGLIVEGYKFLSAEDAERARVDLQKINYLNSKLKYSKPSDILMLYEKAIENKIFKTPIGWEYLASLRNSLQDMDIDKNDIMPIPMTVTFTQHNLSEKINVRQRIVPVKEKKETHAKIVLLVAMNTVLIFTIVAMFFIARNSEVDNIINYKQNITNRYSEWDQELTEREKVIRQKESELNIDTP